METSTFWDQHDHVKMLIRETLLKLAQNKIQRFTLSCHALIFNAECETFHFGNVVFVVKVD